MTETALAWFKATKTKPERGHSAPEPKGGNS